MKSCIRRQIGNGDVECVPDMLKARGSIKSHINWLWHTPVIPVRVESSRTRSSGSSYVVSSRLGWALRDSDLKKRKEGKEDRQAVSL